MTAVGRELLSFCFLYMFRENPLSVSAIKGLLALGVKSQEVEMLVRTSLPSSSNLEWYVAINSNDD